MLPVYDVDADAYRAKVKSFLEKLPSGFTGIGSLEGDEITEFVSEWRQTLFESGYLAPGWPQKYGGAGLSALEQVILAEEFAIAGVPLGDRTTCSAFRCLATPCSLWVVRSSERLPAEGSLW